LQRIGTEISNSLSLGKGFPQIRLATHHVQFQTNEEFTS